MTSKFQKAKDAKAAAKAAPAAKKAPEATAEKPTTPADETTNTPPAPDAETGDNTADTANEQPSAPAEKTAKGTVKLRVLAATQIKGVDVPANQVVSTDAATAKWLVEGGHADNSAPAVAYALTLENAKVISI